MPYSLEEAMALTPGDVSDAPVKSKKNMSYEEAYGFSAQPEPINNEEPFFSRSFHSLTAGISRLEANALRIPGFAYGIAAAPQNIVANLTGWNVGTKTPDWMMDNPLTAHFEDAAKAYSYKQKTYPNDNLMTLIDKKDISGAADYLFQSAIESSPTTIALIAGSLAGVSPTGMMIATGATEGVDTFKSATDRGLSSLESSVSGVVNGTYGAVFEKMGTLGILDKWGMRIAKDVGKKGSKAVIYKTLKNVFGPMFGEMNEEGWTQLAQDFTNKMYGIEDIKWRDMPGRAIESAAVASVTGFGTAIGSGVKAMQIRESIKQRSEAIVNQIQESRKIVPSETTATTESPTVSPEKTAIEQANQSQELPREKTPINDFSLKPDLVSLKQGQKIEVKPPVEQDVKQTESEVVEPMQLEELTKKTISEFIVGETDENGKTLNAEDLNVEDLIIEGKPRKEVLLRAKYLRDTANVDADAALEKRKLVKDLIGRFYVEPNSDIKEEVRKSGIPKEFFASKESGVKSFDEFADNYKNQILNDPNASTSEVIADLAKLNIKRESIKKYIPDAKRQIIEEMQGKTIQRVTPNIKKDIRINTGQVRPGEEPTITESEALQAQLEIAEKASKLGFREGKKVGAESVKSAKQIIERRRMLVRSMRDSFGLSDDDIRRISRRDIRLMDNYEFKKFIDDMELKASQLLDTREAKMMLQATLYEKDFVKVDNLRKFLELPSFDKMTVDQMQSFTEALEDFKANDEFLPTRLLETIDHGELSGLKTIREVREYYAKKAGIEPGNVDVSEFDKLRYDTALARKNPFYRILVDTVNESSLEAMQEDIKIDKEVDELAKKARASRKKSLIDNLIPSDELVFKYMEETDPSIKKQLAEKLTKEELDYANYLINGWNQKRDHLINEGTLEKFIGNYVTHTRRSFLEALKEDGFIAAFKDMLAQQDVDKSVFQIIGEDTGKILPYNKHFRFSMERTGQLKPSKNLAKAYKIYSRAFNKKIAIDKINPTIMAYAYALSPTETTPRGLQKNRELINFVKEYLNNKQGRRSNLGFIQQGGVIDRSLLLLNAFVTMKDLGLNITSGVANQIGDPLANVAAIGPEKVLLGVKRANTKKGKAIIEANRDFIGKSFWQELSDASNDAGDIFHKIMFGMLSTATTRANEHYLLGSMTDKEWESGQISNERKAVLLREMGEYRVVHGARSIIGSTSTGKSVTKYGTWAVPILSTTLHNLEQVYKMASESKKSDVIHSKEFQQLFRQSVISGMALIAVKMLSGALDDDDSFASKLSKRSIKESLGLIGALDPRLWTKPRMLSFIQSFSSLLFNVVATSYNAAAGTDREFEKSMNQLSRNFKDVFRINAFAQFLPDKKQKKINTKLNLRPKITKTRSLNVPY